MNNYLECFEEMKDLYTASINNAMIAYCAQMTKRYNKNEIALDELIKLDRMNTQIRYDLLNMIRGLKEVMIDADR